MLVFDILMRWFDVVAQLTALSILLGPMKRFVPSRSLTRLVLGAACGGFASLEMLQPLVPTPGVILDLRTLPVAIAASFLGRGGAGAAVSVALVTRLSIGGAGAIAGVGGLFVVAFGGLLWARFYGLGGKHSVRQLLLLGAIPSLSLPFFLIIPGDVGWGLLKATFPIYVPLNMAGMIFVGWVIDRERFLLRQHIKLEVESRTDHLTGLLNRRGMEEELAQLLPKGAVEELLLVDCDRFKAINDQYGHAAGDQVLIAVAGLIAREAGSEAIVARFGGDEFAVARLAGAAPAFVDIAGRLRRLVQATPIPLPGGETITALVSIGRARWVSGDTFHSMLLRADQALYAAKDCTTPPSSAHVPEAAASRTALAVAADQAHGGCVCGDLRLVTHGAPLRVGICHCLTCRKHHGALFHASAIFPETAVSITGPRQSHEGRFFCPRCGASVYSQTGSEIEVHLGSLDAPNQFRPSYELWTIRREAWLPDFGLAERFARDRADPDAG